MKSRSFGDLMRVIIILVLGFIPGLVFANELNTLVSRLQSVMQDKSQLSTIQEKAKERTTLCDYCHGSDGISSRPYIPNLAAQHPTYLLKQMLHFADGTRKSSVMGPLAKKLTKEDMINIAIYYANKPVPEKRNDAQTYDAQQLAAGKNIYHTYCAQCHGATGQGSDEFPRLSGQKVAYVVDTLKIFASPDMDENNPLLFDAVRSNPEMVSIVRKLKPSDMQAVAYYIATLH